MKTRMKTRLTPLYMLKTPKSTDYLSKKLDFDANDFTPDDCPDEHIAKVMAWKTSMEKEDPDSVGVVYWNLGVAIFIRSKDLKVLKGPKSKRESAVISIKEHPDIQTGDRTMHVYDLRPVEGEQKYCYVAKSKCCDIVIGPYKFRKVSDNNES